MNNVWNDPSCRKLRESLVQRLLDWYIDTIEKQGCIVPEGSDFDQLLKLTPNAASGLSNEAFYRHFNPRQER